MKKTNITRAVIIAGGKGRRLGRLSEGIPKPMIKIGDKPLLEHQVFLLKKYGIKDICICTGHLSEVIEKYFGTGDRFGVKITYSVEDRPLGSAGCLKQFEGKIQEDFLILYGDVMLDMNLLLLIKFHKIRKGIGTIVVHSNDHPYDSDLIDVDSDSRILAVLKKPHKRGRYYSNITNAGVYMLSPAIFKFITKGKKEDFAHDVFPKVIKKCGRLYAYNTPEYLKDAGTVERLKKVKKDYSSGKIVKFNLSNKRPAIFLDRDGVVNKEIDLLHNVSDFELLPNVARAIKLINGSEFYSIVVTNQPVVARGLAGIKDVEYINKKMETLLGRTGAKLDRIYYCPHHPDKGYKGENKRYKVDCSCRKPKIGLIRKASKNFNIDFKKSFIIGDSTRDIQTGLNAKLKTIGLSTGYGCKDGHYDAVPDAVFSNLLQAVRAIVKGKI